VVYGERVVAGGRRPLTLTLSPGERGSEKRSGIVSDPNREDDPEYIVRLVGQVVRVSVETVKIVKNLPEKFA
jgi:predicted helicase